MHVIAGSHSEFAAQLTPLLQLVIKGIQRAQATSHTPRVRRPITLGVMQGILNVLSKGTPTYHNTMMWAACCTAFFGFLRSSEFTVQSQEHYNPTVHLSLADVAVDRRSSPQVIQLRIKQSKTDPFRQGINLYLGKTGKEICPIKALLPYLVLRGDRPGPLFLLQDGRRLTRQIFATTLDNLLKELHLNPVEFNTHSFRIGAATSAKEANISDMYIKMLGRWRSDAYQCYVYQNPSINSSPVVETTSSRSFLTSYTYGTHALYNNHHYVARVLFAMIYYCMYNI